MNFSAAVSTLYAPLIRIICTCNVPLYELMSQTSTIVIFCIASIQIAFFFFCISVESTYSTSLFDSNTLVLVLWWSFPNRVTGSLLIQKIVLKIYFSVQPRLCWARYCTQLAEIMSQMFCGKFSDSSVPVQLQREDLSPKILRTDSKTQWSFWKFVLNEYHHWTISTLSDFIGHSHQIRSTEEVAIN